MRITVTPKRVYGRMLYVPQCELSKLLARFKDGKMLTPHDLEICKEFGVEVVYAE